MTVGWYYGGCVRTIFYFSVAPLPPLRGMADWAEGGVIGEGGKCIAGQIKKGRADHMSQSNMSHPSLAIPWGKNKVSSQDGTKHPILGGEQ